MNYLPERDLVILLLKKDNYLKYFKHINLSYIKDNYKELHYVYLSISGLQEKNSSDYSLDDLQTWFFIQYPQADKVIYLELFKTLSETTLDDEVGVRILQQIKRRETALKLSEACFQLASSDKETSDIESLYQELTEGSPLLEEPTENLFVSDDLELIVQSAITTPGLRWRLNCLNKSLGSLRRGDFGFLFARPETGKTTFLVSEVSHMLTQLKDDRPIVWFNNEEQSDKVMLRMYQAYFGVRLDQLMSNVKKYRDEFKAQTKGRFLLLKDDASIEKTEVERILQRYTPSLIIYDQIDKIKGFKADRDDLVYGAIYQWARELAKKYAPSIGVCQADGTAEGQKWLHMGHVANAKTSKQAEADFILGIGRTNDEGAQYIRYLNLSKNKLVGDEDTIAHLRHARFDVLIEPEIARYKDIVLYE